LKKNYPWNVLVFPAASEVGLEIHRALRDSKEVVLHGAQQPGASVAAFHFQHLHELPSIHDLACLLRLQALIAAHKIDAIFPAYDDIVEWLAKHATQLAATVITSDISVCTICRSKRATYQALGDVVPVPRRWTPDAPDMHFPVFVKPDRGQGSQRARRINSREELKIALGTEPDLLVMDYLPGREYTVDCFSQHGGGVLYAQARTRLQTKNGIATLTRLKNLPAAKEYAAKIASRLDLRGVWFFQMKEDAAGKPHLLEVAPRMAGSMALSRVAGPNFPLLSLYEAAGYPLKINAIETDMVMGRSLDVRFIYDKPVEALYIDLDDTLVIRGKVNTRLVALVFQCRNRGIPVYLLTRHKSVLDTTLAKFRLTQLFDRIIHIPDDAKLKADFIPEKNAVLIDDSFQERHTVAKQCGIRCFDAAGAICLLDERA